MQPWRHQRSPTNLTIERVYERRDSDRKAIFDQTLTEGATIYPQIPWPWVTGASDSGYLNTSLDEIYFGKSGGKFAAPLVVRYLNRQKSSGVPQDVLDYEDGYLSARFRSLISSRMYLRFKDKWTHLWTEIYNANYHPLNVLNSSETRTRQGQNKVTKNLSDATTKPTKSKTRSSTRTPNLSEALTGSSGTTDQTSDTTETEYGKINTLGGSNTVEATHNEFGFNTTAEGGVPIAKDSTTETPRQTSTDSGTDTSTTTGSGSSSTTETRTILTTGTEGISETESESYNTAETTLHTGTDTEDIEDEISIIRTGGMFRPPAELLSLDRDLWLWDFFDIVFDDVDSILTLDIYPERPVTSFYWG